jgi:hypothetical protein
LVRDSGNPSAVALRSDVIRCFANLRCREVINGDGDRETVTLHLGKLHATSFAALMISSAVIV